MWYSKEPYAYFMEYICLLMDGSLQWRHNGRDSVSNHQPHDCLLNRLFRRRSKKTLNLRVTGLCAGNSPETGEFPAQMASNAENVSIWWRHHCMVAQQIAFELTTLLLYLIYQMDSYDNSPGNNKFTYNSSVTKWPESMLTSRFSIWQSASNMKDLE